MRKTQKLCGIVLVTYVVLAVLFRVCAGASFSDGLVTGSQMVTERAVVGEILPDAPVTQTFLSPATRITEISVLATNYGRDISDTLEFTLRTSDGAVAAKTQLETAGLPDGSVWTAKFADCQPVQEGEQLTLEIASLLGTPGDAVSIYCGDTVSAGKFEIAAGTEQVLTVGGNPLAGTLCFQPKGITHYPLADWYWPTIACGLLVLLLLCFSVLRCERKNKPHFLLSLIHAFARYWFLLRQLVSRDFKTKYKRSVLGVLWSFMNPLLTMFVMYIVFSTLFRSSIDNFPAYLLTGIVFWNFFSETTNTCLSSITGNTALITKVYVPKYMYPLSRSVSCMVNLAMSLIPLVGVLLLTHDLPTRSWALIWFPLVCLFLFSAGMGLLLAAAMVFFRDIQFLWSVISMLWMYLTPIFYPVSILEEHLAWVVNVNPLYYYVTFVRSCLIDGISPEPIMYVKCALFALGTLIVGASVFKKTQDRFVLYL